MIYAIQVVAMLPRIIQSSGRDLGELTAPQKAGWYEGILRRDEPLPVRVRGLVAIPGLSIVEKAFIVTIPTVRLDRERIRGVDGSLVVPMDLPLSSTHAHRCRQHQPTTSTYRNWYSEEAFGYSVLRTCGILHQL